MAITSDYDQLKQPSTTHPGHREIDYWAGRFKDYTSPTSLKFPIAV